MEASQLMREDYALYKAEELAQKAMELKEEKNMSLVRAGLQEIASQIRNVTSYNGEASSTFAPVLDYTIKLLNKTPTSFELLVLSSRLKRIQSKLKNGEKAVATGSAKVEYLEDKSFDSVYAFERTQDTSSLLHLAGSASGGVAIAAVRALARVGNAELLKKACFLGNLDAAFEAVFQLEKLKAQNELLEVALTANDAVSIKAVEALFRMNSIEGLLAVAMQGKNSVSLLAVHLLERLGAISALKAISLLSSSAGKAAFQALVKMKMSGISVGF